MTTQQILEHRVRHALRAYAVAVEPDREPPPLLSAGRPRRRRAVRDHRGALLTAAAVVAIGVAMVASVAEGGNERSVPPVAPPPRPQPPVSSTSTAQPVPEARDVPGVTVLPAPNHGFGARYPDLVDITPTSIRRALVVGRPQHFTAVLTYPERPRTPSEAVVLVSAQRAIVSCPGPFVARPGHAYRFTCDVRPDAGRSVVTFVFRLPDGRIGGYAPELDLHAN